jgi:ankyrin repeat protein
MDGGNWKEMFNAACEGDIELVRYHIGQGVDVNYAHPEFLSTPLVAAVLARKEDMALVLLDSGADPNLHSEFDNMTPLQAARACGLHRLEQRLVALGTSVPTASASRRRQNWLRRLLGRRAS